MGETKIQRDIIRYLEKRGAYVARVVVAGKEGTHDLICCYKGKFITFEVKDASSLSPLQIKHGNRILKAGGDWCAPNCVEDVEQALREIENGNF